MRKNLDVLQSFAKALPKTAIRNYATIIGYQDKKFWVTDGFYMLSFEPDHRDNSYPLPEGDCSLPRSLIGESPVKYPHVVGVTRNKVFDQRDYMIERLNRLMAQASFKRAKADTEQLYLDLDTMALTRDVKASPAISPHFLCTIKKHLPKYTILESVWISDDMVKLCFSNQITAFIMRIEP